MILTADIGNTNICIALMEEAAPKVICFERLSTDRTKSAASFAADIGTILLLHGITREEISGCALSSVVPAVTDVMEEAIARAIGAPLVKVRPESRLRFDSNIDDPSSVGADILCDLTGAVSNYPLPLITFDMGTATVASLVTEGPVFQGVFICPGVKTSLRSLTSASSVLPSIDLENPGPVIGTKNADSVKSGLIYGSAGLVDGLIQEIEQSSGLTCTVIATGGLARFIVPYCHHKIIYDPDLLVKGLWQLYQDNK